MAAPCPPTGAEPSPARSRSSATRRGCRRRSSAGGTSCATTRATPSPACSAAERAVKRLLLLLAVAAVAGGIVMALEMAAVRLFAPHFGYSIYVWGTTICVVMAAMVGGYAIG